MHRYLFLFLLSSQYDDTDKAARPMKLAVRQYQ
jgi:hypothetical protein